MDTTPIKIESFLTEEYGQLIAEQVKRILGTRVRDFKEIELLASEIEGLWCGIHAAMVNRESATIVVDCWTSTEGPAGVYVGCDLIAPDGATLHPSGGLRWLAEVRPGDVPALLVALMGSFALTITDGRGPDPQRTHWGSDQYAGGLQHAGSLRMQVNR